TKGEGWDVQVENRTERKLTNAQIVIAGYVMPLGELAPNQSKTFSVSTARGRMLRDFVATHSQNFHNAVNSLHQAFGTTERIGDAPNSSMAASFISQIG